MEAKKQPIWFIEFDPKTKNLTMQAANDDMASPNGLTKNPEGTEIYVVGSSIYYIGVFKRDLSTNNLTLDKMMATPHKNDNVKYDKETKSLTAGSIVYTWGAL